MADFISLGLSDVYKQLYGTAGKILGDFAGRAEGTYFRCPMMLSYPGDDMYNPDSWTIPNEPLVGVTGKNTIIRTPILKNRELGTMKELWSADDWSIEIKGILYTEDPTKLPEAEINRMRWFFEIRRAIEVKSPFLALYGIKYMCIEDIEFPPTPGYNYQAYSIKAYSDKPFKL